MALLRRHLGAVVCSLILATSAQSRAAADPAKGGAAFVEGKKSFMSGDYAGALNWFKKGHEQTQDPAFLLNIAQCHRSLGETQAALNAFKQYLASEATNPDARAVATKAVNELERPAGASPPPTQAATGPVGSPGLDSGHRFTAQPDGMPVLEPLPESQILKASPGTAEATDGTEVASDKTRATARHLRAAAMVFGAVGLVSSGVGVYYWTQARSLSDDANKATIFNKADYDAGERAETRQWIFYGVGGTAVLTGVGLFVYSTLLTPAKQASVSLAPMVGPGTTGLAAGGTF